MIESYDFAKMDGEQNHGRRDRSHVKSERSGSHKIHIVLLTVGLIVAAGGAVTVTRPSFAFVSPSMEDTSTQMVVVPHVDPEVAVEEDNGSVHGITAPVDRSSRTSETTVEGKSEDAKADAVSKSDSVDDGAFRDDAVNGFYGWPPVIDESDVSSSVSSTVSNQSCVRATHQCNSWERLEASEGAWGIEVDVREPDYNGDAWVYHDDADDTDLRLSEVLAFCKEHNQVAILDMKWDADLEETLRIVCEADMLSQTRFQVGSIERARSLVNMNDGCLVWMLNGAGEDGEIARLDELEEGADVFVGMNICGNNLDPSVDTSVVDRVHAITGHSGKPMELCVFGYGNGSSVYGLDSEYESIGVDVLMANKVP